jgi:hypothetical protein
VDGYNLSYLKPGATAAAIGLDEYAAPMVAHWQRGVGRAGAVSFPRAGPMWGRVREWAGYGDFVRTLTRWVSGEELPPGLGLRVGMEGNTVRVELLHDASWVGRMAGEPPRLAVERGAERGVVEVEWERLRPGVFRAELPLGPGEVARGAVRVGGRVLGWGPVAPTGNAEWAFDGVRREEFVAVARGSGGREIADFSRVWEAPRLEEWVELRAWVLGLLAAVVVAEALASRLGWTGLTRRADAGDIPRAVGG